MSPRFVAGLVAILSLTTAVTAIPPPVACVPAATYKVLMAKAYSGSGDSEVVNTYAKLVASGINGVQYLQFGTTASHATQFSISADSNKYLQSKASGQVLNADRSSNTGTHYVAFSTQSYINGQNNPALLNIKGCTTDSTGLLSCFAGNGSNTYNIFQSCQDKYDDDADGYLQLGKTVTSTQTSTCYQDKIYLVDYTPVNTCTSNISSSTTTATSSSAATTSSNALTTSKSSSLSTTVDPTTTVDNCITTVTTILTFDRKRSIIRRAQTITLCPITTTTTSSTSAGAETMTVTSAVEPTAAINNCITTTSIYAETVRRRGVIKRTRTVTLCPVTTSASFSISTSAEIPSSSMTSSSTSSSTTSSTSAFSTSSTMTSTAPPCTTLVCSLAVLSPVPSGLSCGATSTTPFPHNYDLVIVKNEVACAKLCNEDSRCQSFSINGPLTSLQCQHYSYPTSVVLGPPGSDFTFFDKGCYVDACSELACTVTSSSSGISSSSFLDPSTTTSAITSSSSASSTDLTTTTTSSSSSSTITSTSISTTTTTSIGSVCTSSPKVCTSEIVQSPPAGIFCGSQFHTFLSNPYYSISTTDLLTCGALCFQDSICVSFSYSTDGVCSFNKLPAGWVSRLADGSDKSAYDKECYIESCTGGDATTCQPSSTSTSSDSSSVSTSTGSSSSSDPTSTESSSSSTQTSTGSSSSSDPTLTESSSSSTQTSTGMSSSSDLASTESSTIALTTSAFLSGSSASESSSVSISGVLSSTGSLVTTTTQVTSSVIIQPGASTTVSPSSSPSPKGSSTSCSLPTGQRTSSTESIASPTNTSQVSPVAGSPTSTIFFTTSTVFTTSVYTITACPPSTADCPINSVITKIIALYTTVCPVTEIPSATPVFVPAGSTISTFYTTKVYTITACPSTITNCPLNSVTTEKIALYTTICPVSVNGGKASVASAAVSASIISPAASLPAVDSMQSVQSSIALVLSNAVPSMEALPSGSSAFGAGKSPPAASASPQSFSIVASNVLIKATITSAPALAASNTASVSASGATTAPAPATTTKPVATNSANKRQVAIGLTALFVAVAFMM